MSKLTKILGTGVGFTMMAVSTPLVIAMIHDLATSAGNPGGAITAGTFMAFSAVAGGAIMWLSLRKKPIVPLEITQDLERRVLSVARNAGGRLTTSELAVETSLTLDESRQVLEHLERLDAARPHLSDEGDIVYVFPGFTVDKASAVDPLDDAAVFDAALDRTEDDEQVTLAQPAEVNQEDW